MGFGNSFDKGKGSSDEGHSLSMNVKWKMKKVKELMDYG
jgi:hypothetical protein